MINKKRLRKLIKENMPQPARREALKLLQPKTEDPDTNWQPPKIDKRAPVPDPAYPRRTALVQCRTEVKSAYWGSKELIPLVNYGTAPWFVPPAAEAISALAESCEQKGWDFRVVSGFRSWQSQDKLYTRYTHWLDAGKPPKTSSAYNNETMYTLPVGKPGYGTHQSGRAFDFAIEQIAKNNKTLQEFWDLAEDFGFKPFYSIKSPSVTHSERRHFDFLGLWQGVFERYGYTKMMICATADVGLLGPEKYVARHRSRAIQAQLMRAGADIGRDGPDGYIGAKTRDAARTLGVDITAQDEELWPMLYNLKTR